MDISEKSLESIIERALLQDGPDAVSTVTTEAHLFRSPYYADPFGQPGGFRRRRPDDYNKALCLDVDVVLEFVYATQPKEWEKLKKQHGDETYYYDRT